MTASKTRSAVLALVKETTEGTLAWPAASTAFTVLREGFSFEGNLETVDSDELINDIGKSEGFTTKEVPSASIPKYAKHSGVEGQAPDYGVLIESALGSKFTQTGEPETVGGSTAGTAAARAQIVTDSGVGATAFAKGRAILIKDGVNGYNIRNIWDGSAGTWQLAFNLANAPASGVKLGKPIHYIPVADGHPTFSAHLYQAAASTSALHEAQAGCRAVGMQWEFTANELGQVTFDTEGVGFYRNPIRATSAKKHVDFNIGGSELTVTLTEKTYKSPVELARVLESKMNAVAGTSDITVKYSSSTGKFTIAKTAGTLTLKWQSGTNTATTAASLFGFSAAADDTGSLSYAADDALTYGAEYTPSFDDVGPNVVKYNELMFGSYDKYLTRSAQNVSFNWDVPKTDLDDLSAETGVSESTVMERAVTMTATIYLKKHEIDDFDAFINNTSISCAFNHGPKSAGNWVPGKCVNIYMPNMKLTATPIGDQDGIMVYEVEGMGFVSAAQKDGHINLL